MNNLTNPGSHSLSAEYVAVFNRMIRKFAEQADTRYSYFTDLIYDAHFVLKQFDELRSRETVYLDTYIHSCTYRNLWRRVSLSSTNGYIYQNN